MKRLKWLAEARPDVAVLLLLLIEWALSLASSFSGGTLGTLLHYTSYALPVLLFLLFFARHEELAPALRPTAAGLGRVLPLLPIFLSSVLLISAVTGWAMTALGLPPAGGTVGESAFLSRVLQHALLPAVMEEALFRICVLALLSRRSPARAVPQSALLFALLHASLYQLPYAFVGGIFLAAAALWGGSVVYAMLFHLLNNLLSLVLGALPQWVGITAGLYLTLAITLALFLLAAWGAVVLWRRRRKSGEKLPPVRGWLKELACSPLLLYVLLMLLYALC